MINKTMDFDYANGPWGQTLRDLLMVYKEQKTTLDDCVEQLLRSRKARDPERNVAHLEDDVADAERKLETTQYDLNHFYEIDDADFALEMMLKGA